MSRMKLQEIRKSDLSMLRWWRNCNRDAFWSTQVIDAKQHRKWFKQYQRNGDGFMWVIYAARNRPVGCIALYNLDYEARAAELGRLIITEPQRHKGYGKHAVELVLNFAEHTLGLRSVYLTVKASNGAARALYQECGFEEAPGEKMIRMEWKPRIKFFNEQR